MIKMATWSVALISRIFAQASAEPNLFGLCRAQPKISKQIFAQASAEPNLFELCRAQPKISKQIFAQARAIFVQASAAENVRK